MRNKNKKPPNGGFLSISEFQRTVGKLTVNNGGEEIEIFIQHNEVGTAAFLKCAQICKTQVLCGNLGHGLYGVLKGHAIADHVFQVLKQISNILMQKSRNIGQ